MNIKLFIFYSVIASTTFLYGYGRTDQTIGRVSQALPAVALSQGEFIVIRAIDAPYTPPANGSYNTFKLKGDDAVTFLKDRTTPFYFVI